MEMEREEAVARIRAEIIAPDWRLNQRRTTALAAALTTLQAEAVERKAFRYLLEMARVALDYQERHGDEAPPMVLDFLKVALAQIITVIEEDEPSAERDTEIFNKVHLGFISLKRQLARIRAEKGGRRSVKGTG